MLCRNCGANNPDGTIRCGNCGFALNTQPNTPTAPLQSVWAQPPQPPVKKSKKRLYVLIGSCALALLIGLSVFFLHNSRNSKKAATDTSAFNKQDSEIGNIPGFPDTSDTPDTSGIKNGTKMSVQNDGDIVINRTSAGAKAMGEDGSWTIFVYMCGSDLESSHALATLDLVEMCDASTGSNVRFIVQAGGASTWQNDLLRADRLGRYEICNGNITEIESLPLTSMGDNQTLESFLRWGVQNYPAAKMGVILWNHGSGSINGACFDEIYDYNSLRLIEIDQALSAVSADMTDKYEFIGFDACLMATVECANLLVPYARYMFGSEEIEPGYGWDYAAIGNYLGKNPAASGAELGRVVCDSYYQMCADISQESIATFSILDLSQMDSFLLSFNRFAKSLNRAANSSQTYAAIIRNILTADNYGGNNDAEGYTNMVDIAGIIRAGEEYASSEAKQALDALEQVVIYCKNGRDHSPACGLSTYYPLKIQGTAELKTFGTLSVSPYYLAFVLRTPLGILNDYLPDNFDISALLSIWQYIWGSDTHSDTTTDSYWDSYGECEITGNSPYIDFFDEPGLYKNADGNTVYAFSLTDESLQMVSRVDASVLMYSPDGEDMIDLGYNADVYADWENGIFMDHFNGYWFALPDGQPLAVYIVGEYDGYDVYSSPVKLNGKKTNLRITHNYSKNLITIDGAWDGIDENGMASKEITELKSGDTILPLYEATSIKDHTELYYQGSEYSFDSNPYINFDYLFNGDYLYAFIIYDVYGDYLLTEYTSFTVKNGKVYY